MKAEDAEQDGEKFEWKVTYMYTRKIEISVARYNKEKKGGGGGKT